MRNSVKITKYEKDTRVTLPNLRNFEFDEDVWDEVLFAIDDCNSEEELEACLNNIFEQHMFLRNL